MFDAPLKVKENERTFKTPISRSTLDMRTVVSTFPRRISLTATSSPHWL